MADLKERLGLIVAGFANIIRRKGAIITGDGQQATYLTPEGASDGDVLTLDSTKPEGLAWGPGGGGSSDHKVKATTADTTPGFLSDKLAEGENITLTVLNPGANETIEITSTGGASIADWDIDAPGYFALDEDNGDDANDGFGLTAAAAIANAVRTPTRYHEVIPAVGNGRILVAIVVPRSPAGTAYSDELFLMGKDGYQFKLIRASHDGVNDADEKKICGAVNAAVGPGAGGKWTVGSASDAITFTIGGGALPAANSLNGYRIRFAFDTTTVGLRGECARIFSHTAGGGATIVLNEFIGGITPAIGDTFFIERPGAIFPNIIFDGSSDQNGRPQQDIGWCAAGLESLEPGHGGCVAIGGYGVLSFMAVGGTYFRDLTGCVIQPTAYFEDNSTVNLGVGMRCTGDYQFFNIKTFVAISCDFQSTGNTHGFFNIDRYRIGLEASKFAQVPRLISCGYGPMRVPDQQWCQFGSDSHGGPTNLTVITGPSADIAKGFIYGSNVHIQHVDATGVGADGLICINRGGAITFEHLVGLTGGAGPGIDVRRCQGVTIRNEGSCSLVGTGGKQVLLPGDAGITDDPATDAGVLIKWSDMLKVGFIDCSGNNVGSNYSKIVGVGTVAKNKGVFQIIVGMAVYYDGSAAYVVARSSSAAEASCLFHGVALNTTDDVGTANQLMYVLAPAAGHAYIKNTGEALTLGALGYITNTPGIIGKDFPPLGEFKLRVGYFSDGVSGTDGHMTINAELIPVAADGAA